MFVSVLCGCIDLKTLREGGGDHYDYDKGGDHGKDAGGMDCKPDEDDPCFMCCMMIKEFSMGGMDKKTAIQRAIDEKACVKDETSGALCPQAEGASAVSMLEVASTANTGMMGMRHK